jgi:hypothetical protein
VPVSEVVRWMCCAAMPMRDGVMGQLNGIHAGAGAAAGRGACDGPMRWMVIGVYRTNQ